MTTPTNTAENHERTDQINIVNTATGVCHQDATAENGTVQTHVGRSPIKHEKRPKRRYKRKVDVTHWLTSTGVCEHCGEPMIIRRATGEKRKRYCGNRCRVAAWRARHAAQ